MTVTATGAEEVVRGLRHAAMLIEQGYVEGSVDGGGWWTSTGIDAGELLQDDES